ncbi:MAG: FAD:protein FMN transferase [bacterium]
MRKGLVLLGVAMGIAAVIYVFRPREWHTTAPTMGTYATVTIVGTPFDIMVGRMRRIEAAVMDEIMAVERLMSVYNPDSDVARLNRGVSGEDVTIDPRTFEVLDRAVELSRLTGGAFNVFILPAERLWGFKSGHARRVPSPENTETPPGNGPEISLRDAGGKYSARLLKEGLKIDLGGIAAGYAVDMAVKILKEMNVRSALIDIGGDCYCLGMSAGGTPWRVAVRHPRGGGVLTVLELSDMAVTTSGDYEDFFMENGKRYGHIFDPRTGRPAESGVVSATVVSDTCVMADALATALVVMGKNDGLGLVRRLPSTECILVTEEEGKLNVIRSSVTTEDTEYTEDTEEKIPLRALNTLKQRFHPRISRISRMGATVSGF